MKENHEGETEPRLLESDEVQITLKPEDMVGKFYVDEYDKNKAIQEDARNRLISDLSLGHLDYFEKNSLEGVDNVRSYDEDAGDYGYNSDDNNDWNEERRQRLSQIPDSVKSSPEVQEAAKKAIVQYLSTGNIGKAIEVKDTLAISADFIYSPETLYVIQEEIISRFLYADVDEIIEVMDKLFPERSAEIYLPKLEQVYKNILARLISMGYLERALEIGDKLSMDNAIITSNEVKNAIKTKLADYLLGGYIREAEFLKGHFLLSTDIMTSQEVQRAVREFVTRILSENRYNALETAIEIKDRFLLSDSNITQAVRDGLIARLTCGDAHSANEIVQKFSILPEVIRSKDVQHAAEIGILKCLEYNDHNWIETSTAILDQFTVSSEFLASPDFQKVVKKAIAVYLSRKYIEIEKVVKIKNMFSLSDSSIGDAAKEGMLAKIESGNLDDAQSIRKAFSVSDEFIQSPEVQKAAKEAIVKCLQGGGYNFIQQVLAIVTNLSLPEEVLFAQNIQQASEKAMIKCLMDGNANDATRIKSVFSLPTEIISSAEVQLAARSGLVKCLVKGHSYEANKIMDEFSLSVEDRLLAAKEGMMELLLVGNISAVNTIQDRFSLSQEILTSPEVQQAAIKGMLKCLSDGSIENSIKIVDRFSLPAEVITSLVREQMLKDLMSGSNRIEIAIKIKKAFSFLEGATFLSEVQETAKKGIPAWILKGYVNEGYFNLINVVMSEFSISNDFISSIEIQRAAETRMVQCLSSSSSSDFSGAVKIKKFFSISSEVVRSDEIQNIAIKKVTDWVSARNDRIAIMQIKDEFLLSDDAVQEAVIGGVMYFLSNGQLDYADKVKDQFLLSTEDMSTAAKCSFLDCMFEDKEETADKIREKYKISINSDDIFKRFPGMRNLISDLRVVSPDFAMQAEKTPDLLLSLLEFEDNPDKILNTAKENPFLLEAIASNPRFGSRLLVKYPQFDQLSKKNIETQFAAKKRVVMAHPNIDPQSVEFRTLMQGLLKDYAVNKKVLEDIEARGISTEHWLNYDETAYFSLGSSENTLAFSEIITTPIQRIKETVDAYAYTIKEVLAEYRTELMAFEIKLGKSEVPAEELHKMLAALEKARSEGNDKKIVGIEKGIENLKSKSSQERKGILWEKLLSDVASFQRLKDDVFKAQEIFIDTEKELENVVIEKMPSGKRIQEIKRKMVAAKEDLRSKFSVMERRIEEFRANLRNMIIPALGIDRSDALIQEIDTKLSEQFNHFDTDRSMLKNLFSEQSDRKKDELISRPMSIFVWTRDPDIDLYQGNYSPCCICIDSQHHGAESPISDYNVDLGIQVINVWDETKNEPVTAAWCWLGEDENGEPALVVDNIEANTLFSANFSEQLTSELFKYLKDYAKALGLKKVVLGKANNDLPTAGELSKLVNNAEKYKKIGGANRPDGYFLEAEDENVKVIWEKGVKSNAKKTESDNINIGERIVFDEIKAYPLVEKDFRLMRDLERRVYAKEDGLIQGLGLVRDIKEGNGLEYSIAIWGIAQGSTKQEMIGYAVAVEDETDEGDKSIYLEDIAVAPEAQRQGVGGRLIQELVQRLKAKSDSSGERVFFDMHLRPNSLSMIDAQHEILSGMGAEKIEDVLVPDYYDEREDAVYRVYEISPLRHA